MKKTDYIKEIKKLSNNIKFDDTSKRLFEEFINYNPKELYKVILSLPKENFYNSDEVGLAKYINSAFMGNKNTGVSGQTLYHKFLGKNNKGNLNSIVLTNTDETIVDSAILNSENFINQIFNLAQAVGANFEFGYPKDEHKYHILLESNTNLVCYLAENKQNKGFWQTLIFRYISYALMVNNKKINCDNKQEKIKELSEKSTKAKELYKHLKLFFNNNDFIYAILTYLNTDEKIDLYNLCISKNESYLNHEYMNDILTYINTAFYMYEGDCPTNVHFICDRIAKFQTKPGGKELYKKMLKIIGNRNSVYCALSNLSCEEEIIEVLELIKHGINEYDLVQGYCEYIRARNNYKNGQAEKAIQQMDSILNFWANNKFFNDVKQKMINGEKIQ